ncbi:MAG TPA: ATP synthase subunit I [Deltaproteobacteria bacterium]|nr:ATP synthase subunit I [Deltaproteobacteria bacterium]
MIIDLFVLLAFCAGLGLGVFYFLGLWWTIQRLPDARSPGLLMLKSTVLRLAVVLPCFYLVMSGRWERMAFCLLGFILARMVLTRWIKNSPHKQQEVSAWK